MKFKQRKAGLTAIYGQGNGRLRLPTAGVAGCNIFQSIGLRIIHRSVNGRSDSEGIFVNIGIETEGEPAGRRVCATTGLSPEIGQIKLAFTGIVIYV